MSLYKTEYIDQIPLEYLREAGSIMYEYAEFPAKHFPTLEDYLARVCADSFGLPCILAFRDHWFCGGMTISNLSHDSHLPGKGRAVLDVVAHPFEVGATEAMFGHLKRMLREEQADWLTITRRVSELEFSTKYRRLPWAAR